MGWAGLCRYGGVGDNLIVSSVFKAVREKYGRLEVISQAPQSCVFENNPYIDKLSVHRPGEVPGESAEAWARWHAIRAREYDFFAHLSHSVDDGRLLYEDDDW
jgi:ADP-heptose:LPS heptosyltransferase